MKSGSSCYHSVFQFSIQKYKDSDMQTIILPVILYGSETWSRTLRGKSRLRVLRIGCGGEYLDLRGTREYQN